MASASCADNQSAGSAAPQPRGEFELDDVRVRFRSVQAIQGLSLRIAPGEAVAFVGPNGSGKTTLLNLLNGSVRPDSGRVLVDGECLGTLGNRELKQVRARIGFVHQDLSLIPNLRVSQNVLAGRIGQLSFLQSLRSVYFPRRASLVEAHKILSRVGIGEKLFERTDHLSGGQRQRVALARALYQRPTSLLADEPVSSVDPARARDMLELLTRVSKEHHLTLCMSLPHLELAREFFPRIVGMRAGRILFDGPPGQIGEQQYHDLFDLSADEMLQDGA